MTHADKHFQTSAKEMEVIASALCIAVAICDQDIDVAKLIVDFAHSYERNYVVALIQRIVAIAEDCGWISSEEGGD